MRFRSWIGIGAATVLAAACASQPVHNQVAPTSTVQAAEQAGAAQDERAAKYLALAREDLASAQRHGVDSSRGARALQRASVDSELALSLARDAAEQAAARESQAKVNELKAQQAKSQTDEQLGAEKNSATVEETEIATPTQTPAPGETPPVETPDETKTVKPDELDTQPPDETTGQTPDDMKPVTPELSPAPPADKKETP
jgi:hypothetical protein